jgi:hypothetical protein
MSSHGLTEEQLRQLEAEMEKITVDDVLLQTVVTLLNLGARRLGLAAPPGEEPPPADLEQTRQAIEGARALLPLVEQRHADKLGPVRDGLSQLQIAYAQRAKGGGAAQEPAGQGAEEPQQPKPGEPGPAQQSGRLWVPGQ